MLEAGANCLPVALLFLGVATLAYAVAPRASAGIAYLGDGEDDVGQTEQRCVKSWRHGRRR
jgi:hypothetical protein